MEKNYAAVKVNVQTQKDLAKRFGTLWTPAIFATTPEGQVVHQTIGWLSPADFLTEFTYGLARAAMNARDFEKASRLLRDTVAQGPKHDRAAEAMYWLGVSEYRRTNGIDAAKVAWKELVAKYPASTYAARAGWIVT